MKLKLVKQLGACKMRMCWGEFFSEVSSSIFWLKIKSFSQRPLYNIYVTWLCSQISTQKIITSFI